MYECDHRFIGPEFVCVLFGVQQLGLPCSATDINSNFMPHKMHATHVHAYYGMYGYSTTIYHVGIYISHDFLCIKGLGKIFAAGSCSNFK